LTQAFDDAWTVYAFNDHDQQAIFAVEADADAEINAIEAQSNVRIGAIESRRNLRTERLDDNIMESVEDLTATQERLFYHTPTANV
jgi:hypothetical protein